MTVVCNGSGVLGGAPLSGPARQAIADLGMDPDGAAGALVTLLRDDMLAAGRDALFTGSPIEIKDDLPAIAG